MKIEIQSSVLLDALTRLGRIIPAKSALPILENVLMDAKEDVLTLTASDNEVTLITKIPMEKCESEGRTCIPSRLFTELLKTLPSTVLSIDDTARNSSAIEVTWGTGHSSLPAFPAADYPDIVLPENQTKIILKAGTLASAVGTAVPFTSDDEIRPAMCGVCFDFTGKELVLAASDSRQLISYKVGEVEVDEPVKLILGKKAAKALKDNIGADDETFLKVITDGKRIKFTFGNYLLTSTLIAGKYPKYKDVIPAPSQNVLTTDKAMLLQAVKRAGLCSPKGSSVIKFSMKGLGSTISASDLMLNTSATEYLEGDYTGVDIDLSVKTSHLENILGVLDCESVRLHFSAPNKAVLIVPDTKDSDIRTIVMPVISA